MGNPFEIGKDGIREEVIAKHKEYALQRFNTDKKFRTAVLACKGKRIGCYCKPLCCHLDFIAHLADNYYKYLSEVK